jgi:hypothetical protein
LAFGVSLYFLIRADQPPALLWLALLGLDLVWWWMFLTYLFRHKPLDPVELAPEHMNFLLSNGHGLARHESVTPADPYASFFSGAAEMYRRAESR